MLSSLIYIHLGGGGGGGGVGTRTRSDRKYSYIDTGKSAPRDYLCRHIVSAIICTASVRRTIAEREQAPGGSNVELCMCRESLHANKPDQLLSTSTLKHIYILLYIYIK